MEEWRILPFRRAVAAENMAVDEAVFRVHIRRGNPPTLRFYGWQSPALSIGYFQDHDREVDAGACRQHGVEVVRRMTGGKAVLHERELTYAVVAGDSPLFPADILKCYRVISGCIASGLAEIGIQVQMKADGRQAPGEALRAACFAIPSRYELLVGGRKICGSAQMRSQGAFLQHGSLLLDFEPLRTCLVMLPHRDLARHADQLRGAVTSVREQAGTDVGEEALCGHLQKGFEAMLGIRLREGGLNPEEIRLRDELMERKYGHGDWNRKGKRDEWISGL